MTTSSRPLIAVLQTTLDGKILDADGTADWVDSWADGLELLPPVSAFVLGAGMFAGYEPFWAAILDDRAAAVEMLGREPRPREIAYARLAARTEHLVLSTTLTEVAWPTARIVRSVDEIRALKDTPGDAVYVVGGPTLITSLLDAGLLDELHLIVHPLLVGAGQGIAEDLAHRHDLELAAAEPTPAGRVNLTYRVPHDPARAFDRSVIREFRANEGRVNGELAGTSLLLLTTTGASSGRSRTTPLAYHRLGDRYLVIASDGGAATDPDWYRNLRARPDVTIEVGSERFAATAVVLDGAERDLLFEAIVALAPTAGALQAKAGRSIPVVAFEPAC